MNAVMTYEHRRLARGFTDHEHLNRTGFIHITGRLYDPRIGRFLQADPIVQFPGVSASYNRYSYVYNTPMSGSDPSGFASCEHPEGGCQIGPDELALFSWSWGSLSQVFSYPNWSATVGSSNSEWDELVAQWLRDWESSAGESAVDEGNPDSGVVADSGSWQLGFRDELGANLPMLPQGVVDFSAGLGDGIFVGYGDELRDLLGIDGGIDPASDEYRVGFATGVTSTTAVVTRGALRGYRTGHEIRLGSNVRIAPFGNRTPHPIGRYPHYHRRGVDPATGATKPGQGIGRHRPLEKKSTDKSFWDRF